MNEEAVRPALLVAERTRERDAALRRVAELEDANLPVTADRIGAQQKTAPGQPLEQGPHTEGLPPRLRRSQ